MASCERHEPSFVRKSLSALPGILLLTGVAVFSWFITPRLIALHPFMKSLNLSDFIVAIILGMVICNTVGVHAVFRDGLRFSTTLTKTGIVVMGCKYSFAGLIKTGSEAIIIISVFLFTSAIILMWLSRRLSMSPSLGACLAAGLSICGVSACVAIAPAVRAKNEDIAYTIAVVLMFGLLALFIFPFIGHWLDLSPNQFGAFAGVGIVNSAQVLAAGFAFSNDAGIVAGVYNIGRVICLPLVVLMLAIAGAVFIGQSRKDGFIAKKPTELLDVQYQDWICDEAGLLNGQTEQLIRDYNDSWNSKYYAITAVASIDHLTGWDAEDYAANLGEKWGLGRNDMILLLVKDGDWQVYCGDNVGYAMTDTQQNQLRQAIETTYYSGDFDSAVTAFFRQADVFYAQAKLDGGDSNDSGWYAPAAPAASSGGTSIGSVVVLIIGIFLVWMVLDALRYSRYRRRYIVGAPVNVVRPVYYPIFWGRRYAPPRPPRAPRPPRPPHGGGPRPPYSGGPRPPMGGGPRPGAPRPPRPNNRPGGGPRPSAPRPSRPSRPSGGSGFSGGGFGGSSRGGSRGGGFGGGGFGGGKRR